MDARKTGFVYQLGLPFSVCVEMSSTATVFSSKHCNSPVYLLAGCGS
jgi:hypothetical protein